MLLSNLQIAKILSRHHHTQELFQSCLAWNQLPEVVTRYPSFYIVDVKHSGEDGIGHWCSLWYDGPHRKSYFIDSYAKAPEDYAPRLRTIMLNNSAGYEYNTRVVQSDSSTSCGAFAVYTSDLLARGLSMTQAMNTLSTTHLEANDAIVNTYLLTHMSQQ